MKIIVQDIDADKVEFRSRDTEYLGTLTKQPTTTPWSVWVPLSQDSSVLGRTPLPIIHYLTYLLASQLPSDSGFVSGATGAVTIVQDITAANGVRIRTLETQVRMT